MSLKTYKVLEIKDYFEKMVENHIHKRLCALEERHKELSQTDRLSAFLPEEQQNDNEMQFIIWSLQTAGETRFLKSFMDFIQEVKPMIHLGEEYYDLVEIGNWIENKTKMAQANMETHKQLRLEGKLDAQESWELFGSVGAMLKVFDVHIEIFDKHGKQIRK